MLALAPDRLWREQRIRKSHLAKPGLANKSGILAALFGRAIDLQVDFADRVAPSLAAFSGGQGFGIEHDLHGFLPNCRSTRAPSIFPSSRKARAWDAPLALLRKAYALSRK